MAALGAKLDRQIDELYEKPLDQFTGARNALAKTLSGADAAGVRKLAKPTVVPWAVNQLYWRDRAAFDRLRKAGARLRDAQIAALEGKHRDVRGAIDTHRAAIADAVQRALEIAGAEGSQPNADELSRTLEAVSLARELPEPPGRLTRALQPAGFEALTGVTPVVAKGRPAASPAKPAHDAASLREQREAERKRAEDARQAAAALDRATATLTRAAAAEAQARAAWERAKESVEDARAAVERARQVVESTR